MGHPSDREATTKGTVGTAASAAIARENQRLDEIERRLRRLEVDVVTIGRLVEEQEIERVRRSQGGHA
jgi:hypothetical protein